MRPFIPYMVAIIAILAAALCAQPDMIIIRNTTIYGVKQRPDVKFPHGRHMSAGIDCNSCHHRYVDGKNIMSSEILQAGKPGIKCADCHIGKKSGTPYTLMQAFHRQCMSCHAALERKSKKSGPRLCGHCHRK